MGERPGREEREGARPLSTCPARASRGGASGAGYPRPMRLSLLAFAIVVACSTPVSAPTCTTDVDCEVGFYCGPSGCARDCAVDADCSGGARCDERGRCTSSSADAGGDSSSDAPET